LLGVVTELVAQPADTVVPVKDPRAVVAIDIEGWSARKDQAVGGEDASRAELNTASVDRPAGLAYLVAVGIERRRRAG
jgi:hypothetical protein